MVHSLCEAALVFLLYSFLGWCTEVIYHVVTVGRFINRGFLAGPVCPIYGMGILAVTELLAPWADNLPLLYLGSVVLTSAIELALGWLSQQLLHERLWDYSDVPFNLGGYICLKFSLVWGLACVGVVRLVPPAVLRLLRLLPQTPALLLAWGFGGVMLVDLVVTGTAALQIPRQMRAVQDLEKLLRAFSDSIGAGLSDPVLELMEKRPEVEAKLEHYRQALAAENRAEWEQRMEHLRDVLRTRNRTQRRLARAYPHLAASPLLQRAHRWREYEALKREKQSKTAATSQKAADEERTKTC